jgi:hypothetical protein
MPHEDRIGQSAWDYGTVIIIMIATLAVSPGNARVYGEELLSTPEPEPAERFSTGPH